MDPITTAIVAALSKMAEPVIKDGYSALKNAIVTKFGNKSEVVEAVEKLEKTPDSQGRKLTLEEEIAAVKAHQDEEILKLAQTLQERIDSKSVGTQVIEQTVKGNQNVFSGSGDVSVQFGRDDD